MKKPSQVYASSNSPAGRNGNYSVKLDFSGGARGTVVVQGQPEHTTFTEKQKRRNIKK